MIHRKVTRLGVDTMTGMTVVMALTTAGVTGWIIEWAQRTCEQWAEQRDRNL